MKWKLALLSMLLLMSALSGCALIVGIEDVEVQHDAGMPPTPDAAIDAPMPTDFTLSGVEPDMVVEGAGNGSDPDAGWPVPVIIRGENIHPDATVTLNGGGFNGEVIAAEVSNDGTMIGFELRLRYRTELALGSTESIQVTVRQGAFEHSESLVVQGLAEFITVGDQGGTLSANQVQELYSYIYINQDIVLTGDEPVRLASTDGIVLEVRIDANGEAGDESAGGGPGPAGCQGGAVLEDAKCPADGGGKTGPNDGAGAGGGGHRRVGAPGGDGFTGSPAAGGEPTGNSALSPLSAEGGNGGGGSARGGGGGGGGVFSLTTDGTFTIGVNAFLSAEGGDGFDGLCVPSGSVVVGSSGGGSGGAILIRGHAGIDDLGSSERLSVRGGNGGRVDGDGCAADGGSGSEGRVRVDYPEDTPLPFFVPSPAVRGPVLHYQPGLGTIVRIPDVLLEVAGEPTTSYLLGSSGQAQVPIVTNAQGIATQGLTLQAGYNVVCVSIPDVVSDVDESFHCVAIAYLP